MSDQSAAHRMMIFQERLAAESEGLPKRLRQCADLVARAPERIAVSTVAELAQVAEVPPSALVRFCQVFGFSGFSEMQRLFRDIYAPRRPDYPTRIETLRAQGQDSPAGLLAEFVEAGRHSLANLAEKIDAAALETAVETMARCGTLHIAGFRRAFPVASYMAYMLEKMEIPSMMHGSVGQIDTHHALRSGDALLAVTFAPYTPATIELAEEARRRGLPVVAITDTLTSPLRRLDCTILTVNEVDVGAFRPLAATLSLATALAVATGTRRAHALAQKRT
ncbi:MurR/RpiR family transcriptional regulator [Aliihoeflea sp. PC F10.4]